ncbi:MAG TPA: nitrilase-related carbon-nitrogen hydrolase [Steroidobacteraceae bacterium]
MSLQTHVAELPAADMSYQRQLWRRLVIPPFDSWVALALGCLVLPFSYGADNIALAAWLSPVFLLRFVRTQRWRIAMPVLFVAEMAAAAFQLRGMFPVTGAEYWVLLIVGTVPALIPYAVDRALARKLHGLTATLVFPVTWTVMDYLNAFGPYGSWGAAAYSQYGQLALMQIVSVTGLWSISFLIGWFASVCNLLWEEGWKSRSATRAAFGFGAVISLVLLAGGLRLVLFTPTSPTVRIASLSAAHSAKTPDSLEKLAFGKASSDDLKQIHDWTRKVNDDLLERADRAAEAGAKIIFWAEGNASVLKQDEPALLAEGARLAVKHQVYLGMALAVWTPGAARVLENKLVMLKPDGTIAWQYIKANPVPGDEAAWSVTSDGKLPSIKTPYGILSTAICFDADFPQTLAQAGALNADIVLNPSNDWSGIDPWHTQMASFRAVEQGISIIHQASHGLSAAFDYEGNRLSAMDYFHGDDSDMISDVPTEGVRTLYSRLGDWFAWACGAALLAVVLRVLVSRTRISHT